MCDSSPELPSPDKARPWNFGDLDCPRCRGVLKRDPNTSLITCFSCNYEEWEEESEEDQD